MFKIVGNIIVRTLDIPRRTKKIRKKALARALTRTKKKQVIEMEPCEEMANMLNEMRVLQYEKTVDAIWIRAYEIVLPRKGRRRMLRKAFRMLMAAARKHLKAGE